MPTVDQLPSMVEVFACTIASRKRKIRTPAVSSCEKYPREIQSATMWLDLSGIRSRTSTPRRAASLSASTKSWSGMKYACVIQILSVARSMASRYIDRMGNIHRRGLLRWNRIRGSHCDAVSSSRGRSLRPIRLRRLRFQKSANVRCRSHTPGPVIRTWVSRHSVAYGVPRL